MNITPFTRYHFVNAYVVVEDDGVTLVDTQKLRALVPTTLFVGHAPPVRNPLPAIDRALRR